MQHIYAPWGFWNRKTRSQALMRNCLRRSSPKQATSWPPTQPFNYTLKHANHPYFSGFGIDTIGHWKCFSSFLWFAFDLVCFSQKQKKRKNRGDLPSKMPLSFIQTYQWSFVTNSYPGQFIYESLIYVVRSTTHFPFPVRFPTFRYGVRSTSSLSRLGLHFNLLLTFQGFFVSLFSG